MRPAAYHVLYARCARPAGRPGGGAINMSQPGIFRTASGTWRMVRYASFP